MTPPTKKQCTTRCSCDRDAATINELMGNHWREESEAANRTVEIMRDQLRVQRDETILVAEQNRTLVRRLNRMQVANRIIGGTNNTLRNMNSVLNELLHEIFTHDPAMARFYRERIRFPDLQYSDDEETEDELALDLMDTMDRIDEAEQQ